MLICATGWLVLSAVGAMPLWLSTGMSYLDAYFETMSGFTTTGITLITGLDDMPRSLLLWRAITQWVGGLGILTFFLVVTSRIPGGHLLYGAESHKMRTDRPVPGMAHTVRVLWLIYVGFTVMITLLLLLAGAGAFDSVCHSFTALSTGGFSPHDASVAWFATAPGVDHVMVEYVLILGMLLGGLSFLVHFRVLTGHPRALWDNAETRLFWWLVLSLSGLVLLDHLTAGTGSAGTEESVRTSVFQTVSILTTTGFTTRDLTSPFFGSVGRQAFLLMMVVGGCVGSTAGGVKVGRVDILGRMVVTRVRKLYRPKRAVSRVRVDGKLLEWEEVLRVSTVFTIWMGLLLVGGVMTALASELGGYESFSGMFSAMGNIGPCLISVEEMAGLAPTVKLLYILGMLAGRLEILPVLLMLSPAAWRRW